MNVNDIIILNVIMIGILSMIGIILIFRILKISLWKKIGLKWGSLFRHQYHAESVYHLLEELCKQDNRFQFIQRHIKYSEKSFPECSKVGKQFEGTTSIDISIQNKDNIIDFISKLSEIIKRIGTEPLIYYTSPNNFSSKLHLLRNEQEIIELIIFRIQLNIPNYVDLDNSVYHKHCKVIDKLLVKGVIRII